MAKLNGVKTVDMVNGEITKVTHNGAEYMKVDGKAQVGDIFFETSGNDRVSEGVYYQVVGLDNVNDPEFIDDSGETNAIDQGVPPYNLYYRKVNAKPSQLQVGDAVKVSIPEDQRPAYGWGGVKNGDIGKVTEVRVNSVKVNFPSHVSWTARLTELVKVEEDGYVRVTDREPKAGDYVKFSEDGYDVTAGIYYEVTAIDEDGDAEFIDDAGDENSAVVDYETFEVYEKVDAVKAESLTFKGDEYTLVQRKAQPDDVVVFTEATSGCFENGKTYGPVMQGRNGLVIPDEDEDYFDMYTEIFNRTVDNVKVYAPVAEAEAKLAEQFAKLGRKPSEFKKGDIAKVIDSPSASPNGTLIEITAVYDAHVIGRGWCAYLGKVTTYGYGLNSHIELIAPVESRVDRQ